MADDKESDLFRISKTGTKIKASRIMFEKREL